MLNKKRIYAIQICSTYTSEGVHAKTFYNKFVIHVLLQPNNDFLFDN